MITEVDQAGATVFHNFAAEPVLKLDEQGRVAAARAIRKQDTTVGNSWVMSLYRRRRRS